MHIINRTVPMLHCRLATPVSTDLCKKAAGAFHGDFIHTQGKPDISFLPINYQEVLALEPAVLCWALLWANEKVFSLFDSQAACSIINWASRKNPLVIDSLWQVFYLSAVFNFRLKAIYYKGSYNC